MITDKSILKRAADLTTTALALVFVAYMLDVLCDTLVATHKWVWGLLILIPFHIYFYTGMMGSMVELASGEEVLFSKRNFVNNFKRYALCYVILNAIAMVTGILYIKVFSWVGTIEQFLFHSRFIMLAFFSAYIIKDKYLSPMKLNNRKVSLGLSTLAGVVFLLSLDILLYYAPQFIDTTRLNLPNILGFLSRYVYFLTFTYVSLIFLKQYVEIKERFNTGKELFIINPYPYGGDLLTGIAYTFWDWHPPVFVVLKALTPKNYKIREYYNVIWQDRYYKSNVLAAITCYTSNSPEAYKIAKGFKERGAKVVMGGAHVLNMPDEALDYCDSVVIGDVEGVWQEVIKDYEQGSMKKIYRGELTEEKFGEVYNELMNSPAEVVKDYLEPTRGCKFKCHFCAIPGNIGQARVQTRPIQAFVQLLEKVRPVYNRNLYFIDSNIYSNPAYAKELFEAIKPLNVTWQSAATIDIAKNKEIVKLAKESGCDTLLCGYEIPVDSVEQDKNKKFEMADKYIEYTRNLNQEGIKVKGSFIFGWDSNTWRSLWDLWKFCFKLRPHITTLSILTPIPGSRLYWDMINEGRIVNLNWRAYSFYNLVFKHKNLDNIIFPKIFVLIRYIFFFTTSKMGAKAAVVCLLLLALVIKIAF